MLRRFLRKHLLWAGLTAVMLPLGVLLAMQYRWLVDLERNTEVARVASLANFLASVAGKVEYFYRGQAERALNIPDDLLAAGDPHAVVVYFMKKEPMGAKLLFVVDFVRDDGREILLYDPETEVFGSPAKPEVAQAIEMAVAPWRSLHDQDSRLEAYGIGVEERDPANRIVLNPLTDPEGRVLGAAGMIVDTSYFLKDVLPMAIGGSLKSFDRDAWEDLVISVRDNQGRAVVGAGASMDEILDTRSRFSFIYTDWVLAVGSRSNPVAMSGFAVNLTLSLLLAFTLLGGIVLALRTAAREVRLSEMKSEFVSNVSHELRTPLASVRVFGELLRLGRVREPDKVREYGDYIETESRRLTGLIDNLLDFARIESGAKTYRPAPTDLKELLHEALRTMKPSLDHRGLALEIVTDTTRLPPVIDVDAHAITQAVVNLIDNAAKHSKTSAAITVGLDGGPHEARIWVRDRGTGIPREEQQRIFERFHRVGTSLVHDTKGTGLGLSIVDHIVRAHGGRVSVESEPGRGSTFTIHLPAVRPEKPMPPIRREEPSPCPGS